MNKAAPVLNEFLDTELTRRQLPPAALALVGFSQGTMMSLHAGLRRPIAPTAIVGYSGMFIMPNDGPPETVEKEIASRPPVLLIHGDSDELIPVQALFHASSSLRRWMYRSNGIFRRESATASTRRACAMAASFWRGNSASDSHKGGIKAVPAHVR